VCAQPEGGHIGPPLQKINYLYDRNLVSEALEGEEVWVKAVHGRTMILAPVNSSQPQHLIQAVEHLGGIALTGLLG
jgi:hypothetical protein